MAQRRIDRFAQMSKQEELIAKKRQEILEKQLTAQLAKEVQAEQKKQFNKNSSTFINPDAATDVKEIIEEKIEERVKECENTTTTTSSKSFSNCLTGKTGKISFGNKRSQTAVPVTDQPPPKVQNSFCNDGSFLENFKKILEKLPKPPVISTIETNQSAVEPDATELSTEGVQQHQQQQQQQHLQETTEQQTIASTSTTSGQCHALPPPPQFTYNTNLLPPANVGNAMPNYGVQSPAPPPPPHGIPTAFFTGGASPQLVPVPPPPPPAAVVLPMHAVPPPPPPQLPITLANLPPLYMIPAPEPMQLNAIPAPKEFDLNAIPKPQLNLDAIQVPANEQQQLQLQQQNQQQHQQQQLPQQQQQNQHQQQILQQQQMENVQEQETHDKDNNDHNCIQLPLPTTVENLIDTVAENGDEYEDKIRTHKNQLHPAMWFVFDQNSEQYRNYRQLLNERRCEKQQQQDQQDRQEPQQQEQLQPDESQSPSPSLQQQQQQQSLQISGIEYDQEDDSSRSSNASNPQCSNSNHNNNSNSSNTNTNNNNNNSNNPNSNSGMNNNSGNSKSAAAPSPSDAADKYDPESVMDGSGDIDSDDEWMRGRMDRNRDNLRRRIECRNELSEEERQAELDGVADDDEHMEKRKRLDRKKQRKSRWGEKVDQQPQTSSSMAGGKAGTSGSFGNQNKPILKTITRSDPALLQYARQNYGSTNLSEEDWKKCEEHYKINLLYQDMLRKRQELDRLARSGKFKYEYDSDEDVEGGTWEHKLRSAEMEATQAWAQALTKTSEGKHHIGDFLPPEELKKFMEQYEAKKNNRQPDLSDYKEYKLKEDNIGFQMLQKLGWKEGQGLGSDGAGIVNPINKGPQRDGNQGLGVTSAATPEECDNEYDAYRKRMMLAYRFRPNPLNNPRRAYY